MTVALPAVLVLPVAAMVLRERVVVLGAAHGGSGKTIAEFNAPDARNGKNGMGNLTFNAVPERFSQADGDVLHHAFHHAAQRVAVGLRGVQCGLPSLGVLEAAHFGEPGMELREVEHFLGHHTCCDDAQGEPSAEMSAAAGVVEPAELEVGGEVRMTRTGMLPELLIILAADVFVAEQDGERRAGGVAVINAGNNFREVGLPAGRSARGAGLAAAQVFGKVVRAERNAGQHAVQRYADPLAVRFSKNTDSEFITECVHIVALLDSSLRSE